MLWGENHKLTDTQTRREKSEIFLTCTVHRRHATSTYSFSQYFFLDFFFVVGKQFHISPNVGSLVVYFIFILLFCLCTHNTHQAHDSLLHIFIYFLYYYFLFCHFCCAAEHQRKFPKQFKYYVVDSLRLSFIFEWCRTQQHSAIGTWKRVHAWKRWSSGKKWKSRKKNCAMNYYYYFNMGNFNSIIFHIVLADAKMVRDNRAPLKGVRRHWRRAPYISDVCFTYVRRVSSEYKQRINATQ